MAEYSPMMQKYLETKEEYKDCVLFYRLGDFYEMFFEDAINVSRELELTLTGKDCGQEERAPMCGVPYHAAETYINRLVEKGYKVAICEQVEDPKQAKGLVKREVIKVVTPGTNFNPMALDETRNNYIMSICYLPDSIGIAVSDVTTGEFLVTQVSGLREALDEINKFMPSELLYNESLSISGLNLADLRDRMRISLNQLPDRYYDDYAAAKILKEHFNVSTLEGLGLQDYPTGVLSAGALMQYFYETQKNSLPHIMKISVYVTGKYMIIDSSSRRNLELVETMREKNKRGSLLWVLDKTETAMGARLLRSYIEQPLIVVEDIRNRQKAIKEFMDNYVECEEIRECLRPIYDLERLLGRVSTKSAGPKELVALKASLKMLPYIKTSLLKFQSALVGEIFEELDTLEDIYDLIDRAIVDDPPLLVREGGLIKEEYHEEVDRLRHAATDGNQWLTELEAEERERTGIKNLKVKYNKVFGYYLEVTNSFKDLVPIEWTRKQTLTNAERYTTPRLKELEDIILGASDKLFTLEYDLFCQVRDSIAGEMERIQTTARAVAKLDVFVSLARVASANNYVCPKINDKGRIHIEGGRHPVVEKMMATNMFVENDTELDNSSNRISIITGPNMAGKSTYMRQVALIVLMAQIGSYVPAKAANIGVCDRIFTRVGASDDLASGQSTFMVEMTEVANILHNATANSLLILDEIGRGTSTYDGLSIAWAVVEHIANPKLLGAKTLFATHYHELTELEGTLNSVNNYCIAVREQGDDIIFLRKIVKGGADKSYGIQVAKLAGVPDSVLNRAKELVAELMENDISQKARDIARLGITKEDARIPEKVGKDEYVQMSIFDTISNDDIIEELKNLDLSNMRPIDALNTLYSFQDKIKNRWES